LIGLICTIIFQIGTPEKQKSKKKKKKRDRLSNHENEIKDDDENLLLKNDKNGNGVFDDERKEV